ncbi:ribosomal L1 domain-containing protein 1 [Caerostris darwini]|uniref:Ribosomal L1 domain-containing protein 1 n=1 Tax=Caerostris darwini TaxID=1538125 RepID=A0AAV4RBW1_9ARAC|nr:ribosomal L1 domain-containing protein 1 [Caerostris darwini]
MLQVDKKKINDDNKEFRKICKKKAITKAVDTLKALNEKFVEREMKKQLLLQEDSDTPVFLQLMLKKIPSKKSMKMITISLPHSLFKESSDICLITGDLNKNDRKADTEPDILHYKELLKTYGVTRVSEVVPLRVLRTEYKTFESRRHLAAAYDGFLADKKIAGVLPRALGTAFYQERKFPLQISLLKQRNLKKQIDEVLKKTQFLFSCRGNCHTVQVANLGMDNNTIIENIQASIDVLADKLPGKWNNILGLYLKTAKSKAIPIFVSFENPNDVKLKKRFQREKVKFQELSSMPGTKVNVFRDGRIIVKKVNEDEDDINVNESSPEQKDGKNIHKTAVDKTSVKRKKNQDSKKVKKVKKEL